MKGINKVIIVGTLTKDPESKSFPNGGSLCQLSVATNESWIDKNSGEKKESAEFHRIVLQNKLGEIAQQYLRKGSKVYIEGSLRTRQWTDQSGVEKYTTEVRASNMQMLDSQQQGNGGNNQDHQNNNQQPRQQQNNQHGYQNQGQQQSNQPQQNQQHGNQNVGYGPTPTQQPKQNPVDLDDGLPF